MKNKGLQTILYSTVGILAMAVILIGFNVITGAFKKRVDLTEEKAYTLSAGTKAILAKLDTPVKIRFYCTQSEQSTPETVFLKSYARRVEDLLEEFRQAGHGKVIIEKFNPLPDSDAEDKARFDGIEPEQLGTGEPFYLGLAVSQLDEKQAVPLPPNRERLLEYDVARAISRVENPAKPVIGVMSSLPIWGQPANPMMMQMGQRGSEPWILINELKQDFDVKRVEMTADKIDDGIKVLLVIHPKEISDKAQFAIDQFVMRGGKLIAFLDPYSVVDSRGQNPMMGGMSAGSSSNLEKLLKAWGLSFSTKVVADVNLLMELGGRTGEPMRQPTWLSVTKKEMNNNDITTSEIDNIWLPMAGAFTGTPAAGLKETVLFHSTKDSELVDGMMASFGGDQILKDFKSADQEQTLTVRLTGKFKTAFPEGEPGDGSTNATSTTTNTLKECKDENAVILVGDSDLLYDNFAVQTMNTPFGRLAQALNANLTFAQNCVEQMAGDKNLIQVRSRAVLNRPFEVVKQKEAEANARYQAEIAKLEQSLTDTQQRLNELQAQKSDKSQRFILSPEQEQELQKFQDQEASVRKQLKEVRKKLNQDIVSMENNIKWTNILAMPVLVSLFGIVLAVVKSKKQGAK
ncbi:MAG TPA: Gldg family protein [Verrucomicrobiae bacterium]|nr:Gldg family protein [Verrucomicrobiae bacterium]